MTTPTMTIDGVEYVEAPETAWCLGCAFEKRSCYVNDKRGKAARAAFGGSCSDRRVIYLRKA